MFWRLTGITVPTVGGGTGRGPDIYHFTCTKLGVTYPKTSLAGINSVQESASTRDCQPIPSPTMTEPIIIILI